MASTYNIIHTKNESLDITFTWKDSQEVAVDLTNYDGAKMQIRQFAEAANAVFTLRTDPSDTEGEIILGGIAGTIRLKIPYLLFETSSFPAGKYVYDLVLIKSETEALRFMKGLFILEQGVTNHDVQS